MISPNPFDTLRPAYRQAGRNRRAPLAGRLAAAVVFLLILAAALYWRGVFANAFWSAVSPVTLLRTHLESNQVSMLQAELASTTAALADRNLLNEQNIVLKGLLGRPQISTEVLGAVLLRPPGTPYDTLMIDIGSQDGVAVGDMVFGGGSAVIGDVTDVYKNTSRVSLFSAPGRSYDAQVTPAASPAQAVPISLEGQGAGSFIGQIPAGSVVVVGDPVLLPGIGNDFLGSVSHIDMPSGSSFETLYIQMPVDVFSLQYIEVQTHL